MRIDKVLTGIGRTFIAAGVLVFLFVGYQLWGTSITEQRAQDRLQQEALKAFDTPASSTTSAAPKPGQTTVAPTAPPPVPQGSAIAVIRIPKINIEKAVVAGTSVADLKKGPGHYSETPMPGQKGNVGIAGHRTTYGAPFGNIDQLNDGDNIEITTRQGTFLYKVNNKFVVAPSNVSVLDQGKENLLTLTTCHPKFTAAQRLIVTAVLQDTPAASTPTSPPPSTAAPKPGETTTTTEHPTPQLTGEPSLSGHAVDKTPVFMWGALCVLWSLVVWAMTRRINKVVAYVIGAPIFLVLLFFFFENFSRLLPANA